MSIQQAVYSSWVKVCNVIPTVGPSPITKRSRRYNFYADSTHRIVSSDQFRFLVGEEQKEYSIHAVLVAMQSPVLEKLVNNGMCESRSKTAVWNDIDDATFSYFAEFAYTGDYNACAGMASFAMLDFRGNTGSEAVHCKDEGVDMSLDEWGTRPKKKTKSGKITYSSRREKLWAAFVRAPPFNCPDARHLPRKQGSTIDLTETILTHAKLYVFADRYEILTLMKLSLFYLHEALIHIQATDGLDGTVQLIEYCFTRDNLDALKNLVLQYVTCKIEALHEIDAFRLLLLECGALAGPLVESLLARLD